MKGTAFLYLLLLLAIVWIPETIQIIFTTDSAVKSMAPLVEQVPNLKITNGVVTIDKPTPYVIKDHSGKEIIRIDPSAPTEIEGPALKVLITHNKILLKNSERETRMYDLSTVKDFKLDKALVYKILDMFNKFFAVVFYPIAVLSSFIYRMIQAVIYALIGILIAKHLKVELNYQALVRLAVISITPVLILSTILSVAGAKVPLLGLICFVIAMAYMYFGIKAASNKINTILAVENELMKNKPVIAITMGDPGGVGPEIILKTVGMKAVLDVCRPVIIGDLKVLDEAMTPLAMSRRQKLGPFPALTRTPGMR